MSGAFLGQAAHDLGEERKMDWALPHCAWLDTKLSRIWDSSWAIISPGHSKLCCYVGDWSIQTSPGLHTKQREQRDAKYCSPNHALRTCCWAQWAAHRFSNTDFPSYEPPSSLLLYHLGSNKLHLMGSRSLKWSLHPSQRFCKEGLNWAKWLKGEHNPQLIT